MVSLCDLEQLWIAGDDDQAIYSFNGADVKKFIEFDKIIVASHYINPIIRMSHMIYVFLINIGKARLIFIETYSTRAFYFALIIAIFIFFDINAVLLILKIATAVSTLLLPNKKTLYLKKG